MVYYTYIHRRNDTNQVFYVGKGTKSKYQFKRAYDVVKRNKHWKAVVNKCGHTVEIVAEWSTEDESYEHEKILILCFKGMGHKLTNKTNGGEGGTGHRFVATNETKLKMSKAHLGKTHSEETRNKIRLAHKGKKKNYKTIGNYGKIHSTETKEKIRQSLLGRKLAVKVCPHCQRSISVNTFDRWHGNRCKHL